MPLYEYACGSCGTKWDARKSLEERHKADCPSCGKASNRVMSAFSYTFGWVLSDRCLNEKWGPRDEFVKNV